MDTDEIYDSVILFDVRYEFAHYNICIVTYICIQPFLEIVLSIKYYLDRSICC